MTQKTKTILFREASQKETKSICELNEKIWRKIYHSLTSEAQMEYMLQHVHSEKNIKELMEKNNHFFVGMIDDQIIAYASLYTTDGKIYDLSRFYIDTDLHGQGIGEKFLNYLEEKHSPEVLYVDVNRRNYKAINFYFKNGFMIEKLEDKEFGEGFEMHTFTMIKKFI
ncbi:MAG: GNAT family N-acetyltransferase [Raineya sp.]|jgi:ribosomal protein S18 acetylase RimI-like enzyme|nr:GNAT family N-acetyltransferase [Raineya sp.]